MIRYIDLPQPQKRPPPPKDDKILAAKAAMKGRGPKPPKVLHRKIAR